MGEENRPKGPLIDAIPTHVAGLWKLTLSTRSLYKKSVEFQKPRSRTVNRSTSDTYYQPASISFAQSKWKDLTAKFSKAAVIDMVIIS